MKRVLRSTPEDSRSSDLKRKKNEATMTVREGRRRSSPSPDDSPSRSLMASHRSTPRTPSAKGKHQQPYHKATWDRESTQIFLQLVVKEIETGNRPHMSITPNGYRSLSKTFEVATGRLYSLKQLKNKYNLLKTEWRAWCKLMDCRKGPTGIGFDQMLGTFNASTDWWAKMEKLHCLDLQIDNVCCKFRTKTLDHPDLMERVFTGAAATGKNTWTPGETRNPMELDGESDSLEFSSDSNDLGASKMAAMMDSAHFNATGSGSKQKHSSGKALQNKRVMGAEALASSMDDLLNSVKTQSKELIVNHVVGGHSVTMGQAVGPLYEIQGLVPEDELLHFGVMLMEVPNNREMVMSIPMDQGIIGWLRAKKQDKDRSGGVTLASLLRNEGVRF
ncbi:L10-interacting MYB domain-containing protein [Camellia lanceoleosa]|uniref:L10-interacting MYB domain-containing protein n=1 Tax=Camellia lanceoleosa TaxID=1840588 RepID=A0ACC0IY08_9ERIC|nr:L10-interacting MYB domain-containing protein [Camellia lanceoleosa]